VTSALAPAPDDRQRGRLGTSQVAGRDRCGGCRAQCRDLDGIQEREGATSVRFEEGDDPLDRGQSCDYGILGEICVDFGCEIAGGATERRCLDVEPAIWDMGSQDARLERQGALCVLAQHPLDCGDAIGQAKQDRHVITG